MSPAGLGGCRAVKRAFNNESRALTKTAVAGSANPAGGRRELQWEGKLKDGARGTSRKPRKGGRLREKVAAGDFAPLSGKNVSGSARATFGTTVNNKFSPVSLQREREIRKGTRDWTRKMDILSSSARGPAVSIIRPFLQLLGDAIALMGDLLHISSSPFFIS